MKDNSENSLLNDLEFIYGPEQALLIHDRLKTMLSNFNSQHPGLAMQPMAGRVSEEDSILITYGDMVMIEKEAPLNTLASFLSAYVADTISTIHLLPFFPFSSDDGFSVIDYLAVDSDLGTWDDVTAIGKEFRLMFDAVVNHISAQSPWFQGFLEDKIPYRDYFTIVEPGTDLSQVFRPRTLPLLTPVKQKSGQQELVEKYVWTTFSPDQIDLNYSNSDLLLDVLETLLFYVAQGAEFIRLDAIAFIWKEIGTSCIHLPQTHHIVQIMRKVLNEVSPGVALITETNVPHEDNISYFGDGYNEAQLVYNFSLPPLVLNAIHTGNAQSLSQWTDSLSLATDQVTFFNFLASHDGIGVTPARDILGDSTIDEMAKRVEALGGAISYKTNPGGSRSPYELNINYLDALGDPNSGTEDTTLIARRFLASQAIMLSLRGVPGIYFHSLFGSRSWREGMEISGRARTINREKLSLEELKKELADPATLRHQVFSGYCHLLNMRRMTPAFHPNGAQNLIFCNKAVFSLSRTSLDLQSNVLCLHNVSGLEQRVLIDLNPHPFPPDANFLDLLGPSEYSINNGILDLMLMPYQVRWLNLT